MNDARSKWDAIYSRKQDLPATPDRVLVENRHLLPRRGSALEIACGLAGNAVLLAGNGLSTLAWDISAVALRRVAEYARREGLPIVCETRDVTAEPPPPDSFDVIVVTHFLERSLTPYITAALRPGGLLFYQTFTRTRVTESGPGNEAFRLDDGELLALFRDLRPLVYREEGRVGDIGRGFRDEALLVALKAG